MDKELNKKENEFLGSADSAPTENEKKEVPEGFTAINPPAVAEVSSEDGIVSAEATDRVKILDSLVKDLTKNFVKIGFELFEIQRKKLYKELGFKTFEDFTKGQYGFSRSSAYNFINVCTRYSIHDDDGFPTKLLKKEYAKFSSSQLVAMLRLNEDAIAQVDPSATVREINKIGKSQDTENADSEATEEAEDSDSSDSKEKKSKNVRDTNIPVMRLNIGTGLTWDSTMTEKVKKACQHYLTDERRELDGKQYRLEVNIIWNDETAM